MPRTVDEGFRDFLSQLTPSGTESDAAKRHRVTIEQCLKAKFGLRRFTRMGSFGNGTSISGFSDIDYLACLPRAVLTPNSKRSLTKVRLALDERFPSSDVHMHSPAIVLPFGVYISERHEVVPANSLGLEGGYQVYEIADGAGGWMRTSPDAHNEYVRTVDARLNGKAKRLIRLLKAWKFHCNVPISSFYLELRAAKYASGEESIFYPFDLEKIFTQLLKAALADMQDPTGVSRYIPACESPGAYEKTLSGLQTAATRAEKALWARDDGRIADAFYWWKMLFSGAFPAYYR